MITYLVRRLVLMVPTLFGIMVINFVIINTIDLLKFHVRSKVHFACNLIVIKDAGNIARDVIDISNFKIAKYSNCFKGSHRHFLIKN